MFRRRPLRVFFSSTRNGGRGVLSSGRKPPSITRRQAIYQCNGLMCRALCVLPSCVANSLNACCPLIQRQGVASALLRFAIMPPRPHSLDGLCDHDRIHALNRGRRRKNDLCRFARLELEHAAPEWVTLQFATELNE